MFVTMNPQLDLLDEIVRILGWPAVVTTLVWVVRKWDAGQQAVKDLTDNTALAVQKVSKVDEELTLIKSNHLQHLQSGIDQLGKISGLYAKQEEKAKGPGFSIQIVLGNGTPTEKTITIGGNESEFGSIPSFMLGSGGNLAAISGFSE